MKAIIISVATFAKHLFIFITYHGKYASKNQSYGSFLATFCHDFALNLVLPSSEPWGV